jgi:hypothetical protein
MPGRLRKIRAGDEYTAEEDTELEAPEPDAEVPEADQHGDVDHEGGPDDGGN